MYSLLLPELSDMKDKLRLEVEKGADDKNLKVGISAAIDMTDGEGSELSGSLSLIPKCSSYGILEQAVTRIKKELDTLLEKSKKVFEVEGGEEADWEVNEDMGSEEIWDVLSKIKDPKLLSGRFNSLSHQKRLEVADYVFTHGNIFSGAASVFSARYNSEKGMLE
jgi:hypothetical protein